MIQGLFRQSYNYTYQVNFKMSDYQEQEYGREGGGGDRGAKKEPGPDEVKLFVGNLSFEASYL